MRILMVSKALVVGTYQRKLEEMAALPGVELIVAVPPYWREQHHVLRLERSFCQGYTLLVTPMRFNGHYHYHYYPQLGRLLDRVRPDLLHIDEEPFNLATWLAVRQAQRRGIPTVFYTWQNILQRFPIPYGWLEADVLRRAALGLAGNRAAADNLRTKGFRGEVRVVPQFGTDPELFSPAPRIAPMRPFTIGFLGRIEQRKGLGILLEAVAALGGSWKLHIVGTGTAIEDFKAQAANLGIAAQVSFLGQVPSTSIPDFLRGLDVLVGPSLTVKRWKEQFGRMLVEAMACEIAVVGSDSGEIPQVIGEAGIVVPEGDVPALCSALQMLRDQPELRKRLGRAGRQRMLTHYTQAAVARDTVDAYRLVVASNVVSARR